MSELYISGKFVSSERKKRIEEISAAFAEVAEVLQNYDVTIADLYREYVYRVRGPRVMRPDVMVNLDIDARKYEEKSS